MKNSLAQHYTRFRVSERLLLTGHSHQAWPDCAEAGLLEAFADAAEYVDGKWEKAFAATRAVAQGYASLLEDTNGFYAIDESTHNLVTRLFSALDFQTRPRIVSTDGEFHTVRRLLQRLEEDNMFDIVRESSHNVHTLAERMCAHINDKTSIVIISAVMFQSGLIVPYLESLAQACEKHGCILLVDAYHAINVAPFSVPLLHLETAYITGGGYKYCQLGEGCAFLRIPPNCSLRPRTTGWFAELFDTLAGAHVGLGNNVAYPPNSGRFAGATYDPTPHYRARCVLDFFKQQNLTPALLRTISQRQIQILCDMFDACDFDPTCIKRNTHVSLCDIGGFLALQTPHANNFRLQLLERGVYTDCRGDILRLGPAPYMADSQLTSAMQLLEEVCTTAASH